MKGCAVFKTLFCPMVTTNKDCEAERLRGSEFASDEWPVGMCGPNHVIAEATSAKIQLDFNGAEATEATPLTWLVLRAARPTFLIRVFAGCLPAASHPAAPPGPRAQSQRRASKSLSS